MSRPVKIVVFVAAILMLAGAALAAVGGDLPMAAGSRADAPGDISGPCDEAEHANDPRCTGVQVPDNADDGVADDDAPGDISGPCDEAEHANDPRCTGVQVPGDDDDDAGIDHDRRGHGSGDEPEDRGGPGSGDDDHDNSGPGSGGDDNSGPDHGDDNSGSGSSDDD